MPYRYQCSILLQDCETLWPPIPPDPDFPAQRARDWADGSCVQDVRLPGTVGRCGWSGAPCSVTDGASNCAYETPQICQNSICVGAVGDVCMIDDDCNFGIYCNTSTAGSSTTGICGGAGAQADTTDFINGLDFGRDYCLSGLATEAVNGSWICAPGPSLILTTTVNPSSSTISDSPSTSAFSSAANSTTSPSHHHAPPAAIIGGVVGALVFLLILIWFFRRGHHSDMVISVPRDQMERDVTNAHLLPIPFPYALHSPSSSVPVSQPHPGQQEEPPPPFTAVAEEGTGVQVPDSQPPPPPPIYSKRWRR